MYSNIVIVEVLNYDKQRRVCSLVFSSFLFKANAQQNSFISGSILRCRSQWPLRLGRGSAAAEIADTNPAGGRGWLSLVSVVR
jgi:hypothetical protein